MYKKILQEIVVRTVKERTGMLTVAKLIKFKPQDIGIIDFTYKAHGHGVGWEDRSGWIDSLGNVHLK